MTTITDASHPNLHTVIVCMVQDDLNMHSTLVLRTFTAQQAYDCEQVLQDLLPYELEVMASDGPTPRMRKEYPGIGRVNTLLQRFWDDMSGPMATPVGKGKHSTRNQAIAQHYLAGASIKAAAQKAGLSMGYVHHLLVSMGVPRRPQGKPANT